MRAVLLCAGFATRMYPLTRDFPKPLLEVGGRPILEDLVSQLLATGRVGPFTLVSNGRFAEHFRTWHADAVRRLPGLELEIVDDGAIENDARLGAVRDLALALEGRPGDEPLLVAAGDNLFRFSFDELLDDHAASPRNLILAQREGDPERLRRSGVAELGADGRVLRFVEKPAEPAAPFVCPPLYLYQPSALARLPEFLREEPAADAPGSFVAWLCAREPVFAHQMRGSRLDVGDIEAYRSADAWLRAGEAGRP
ncbi:MAG: nucleotidyltransferase family protein [Myxococcota bacterium]|nr:nucleotidyltransferase family protein [Myxococcota bacterium]